MVRIASILENKQNRLRFFCRFDGVATHGVEIFVVLCLKKKGSSLVESDVKGRKHGEKISKYLCSEVCGERNQNWYLDFFSLC